MDTYILVPSLDEIHILSRVLTTTYVFLHTAKGTFCQLRLSEKRWTDENGLRSSFFFHITFFGSTYGYTLILRSIIK